MKMLENWLRDDFGAPLACLATSFTFDTTFFTDDCLARFLGVNSRDPDGATGLDIAGMLEEEELLSEARVCVLVDQSCRPEPRNLRWDLLPIRVPGGLLHAKVAVLIWQKAARIIIGSANLTNAGYRNQVEVGMALNLDSDSRVPRQVFTDLAVELRSLVTLSPGDPSQPGPTRRALEIIDLFERRIAEVAPPESAPPGVKFSLAVAKKGVDPLDQLDKVWSGGPPQSVVALSPFWDDREDMPGARAVLRRLAGRAPSGGRTTATFVVPVDSMATSQTVRAPRYLLNVADKRVEASVVAFKSADERRLHAKCLQYKSSTWVSTMFGSSNITAKGLGLDPSPHREINLWIGCRSDSPHAKALSGLIPIGDKLGGDIEWDAGSDDEDESALSPLPSGFSEALLVSAAFVELSFDSNRLPAEWTVEIVVPGGQPQVLLSVESWRAAGSPQRLRAQLPDGLETLPSLLDVRWDHQGQSLSATWLVNIGDGSVLPPPSELRELSVDVLLSILASTRPLRAAYENAITRKSHERGELSDALDPLKRFDSSGFLLQRTRRSSAALWGIERRLNKQIHSMEALEWRLAGTLGPEHLASKLVENARESANLPGEAEFLLAELALTVHRIPWSSIRGEQPPDVVVARVRKSLELIRSSAENLDSASLPDPLHDYVQRCFAEVAQ